MTEQRLAGARKGRLLDTGGVGHHDPASKRFHKRLDHVFDRFTPACTLDPDAVDDNCLAVEISRAANIARHRAFKGHSRCREIDPSGLQQMRIAGQPVELEIQREQRRLRKRRW